MSKKPVVWSIGGSDCSGGAGCQADILTCQDFDVHVATVLTTITAQNAKTVFKVSYCDSESIQSQIAALKTLPPTVIKLGLLGTKATILIVTAYLQNYSGTVICDPVFNSTSGVFLNQTGIIDILIKMVFPRLSLLTPNIPEAEILINRKINSLEEISVAAHELLKYGVNAVLLKGGHLNYQKACDFFTNGKEEFWLVHAKMNGINVRGTGCALSSAISSALALGYSLNDALVIAKMYIQQSIRNHFKINTNILLGRNGFPKNVIDFPWVMPKIHFPRVPFLHCGRLGFYPIVDTVEWVRQLLSWGVHTIQLRIKNGQLSVVRAAIIESVRLAKEYRAKLFINDYWQLAIEEGAYGVHLGQEDLETADVSAIRKAGLRLGISTHSLYELARVHAIQPSYIAFGPIYQTTSKPMIFSPRGLSWLQYWCKISPYPVVAIGGINLERLEAVLTAGAENISVISAVTKSIMPQKTVFSFLNKLACYVNSA
ncbi:thiamine phosphate synthase [Coxiella endosymbiont of Amblyomma nuttalli]|uniref:thiamine phosphate synthase n=1 Tax=Coxiella endosymbiont of Amblyomma nuttalli TaxID=2749996 RepID=UPI001BA5FCDC|nr:thiamine phosphate synthase [Coxiella endosymbiont of Amblyomma nuttalli]QTS84034.1 Thiamine-phosphate synthase [Coxiella endosymbiont of Amblyomma nuttalli]